MTPTDWTLLVIGAADGKTLEPVHLQKSLYLLGRNLKADQLRADKFYDFEAYDYGPFCADIYSDAERLEGAGLIAIDRPPQVRFKLYRITEAGAARFAALAVQLDSQIRVYLSEVVKFTTGLDFSTLVSTIYKAYPETRVNSVFKG
jgi:hypothetical protein